MNADSAEPRDDKVCVTWYIILKFSKWCDVLVANKCLADCGTAHHVCDDVAQVLI